jgi:hypothetical protein
MPFNEIVGIDPEAERIEALRQRGATALERSLGFVEKWGTPLAGTRARVVVEVETVDLAVEALAERQGQDGSFSRIGEVFAADLDSDLRVWDSDGKILGALEAISILTDWQALHSACAERTIEYLRSAQWEDGGWGSGFPGEADHPTRIFATAVLAGFLGRSRSARPKVLEGAGAYVTQFWSVERMRSGGWPMVAGFAAYFTNVFDEGGEAALPWCGRELARGLAAGEYSAGMILRCLFYCEAEALPGVEFDTLGLLETLLDEQLKDGGFGREGDAVDGRIGPTLDAMLSILRLCRVGAPTDAP